MPEPNGEPFAENGDPDALLLPLRGVADLEYRGGVMYWDPGVAGCELGLRPRSDRCCGVRGTSERSSGFVNRGRRGRRTYASSSIGKSVVIARRNSEGS